MRQNMRLTVNEVIKEVKISRATLYRLVDEGLPYIVVGTRKKLFDPDEVTDFIKNRSNELQGKLEIGKEYTNEEIMSLFSVSPQGGMRRSKGKNALVLFSFHDSTDRLYEDYWKDDILYYTGMGQRGDQDLNFSQNKTLYESPNTSIVVYLFEMYKPQAYRYKGIVRLVGEPFQAEETDLDGNLRKVWKFPLEVISSDDYLPESVLKDVEKGKEKALRKLDDATLEERARAASETGVQQNITVRSKVYVRNQAIAAYAKRRANGICQLCGMPAPFEVDGVPFLEEHHLKPLGEGGLDVIENASALCPNCHTRMHKLNLEADKKRILARMAIDEEAMQEKIRKADS